MADKKVVSKVEPKPKAEFFKEDKDQVEIDRLTIENKSLLEKIVELEASELDSHGVVTQQERDLEILDEEIAQLKAELKELPDLDTAEPTAGLRTTMLMAMLPQVRVDYPRPDAQKALEAVDVILDAWGMK